jgi:4-diphosphocytidyl-2-C-methyl-D-erythritol kinase
MQSLSNVLAPAKLNLFLHITGRRSDGYHLLQSVFILIDWYDTLHFEKTKDASISRTDTIAAEQEQVAPLPHDDLCVQAARALQKASGTGFGAQITLNKSIPQQAGLGGGSSNAASTLLALNKLWGLDWSRERLLEIAVTLGADVPFFLIGKNAWVEGIGDILQPIDLPVQDWVVLKPNEGVSTKEIFNDPMLQRHSKTVTISDFAVHPFGYGRNDLQPVAERLCPSISQAIVWLSEVGLQARMTGSGSAVFAHLASREAVHSWPALKTGWQFRMCSNLDVHPHADWASSDKYR